ncbi:MAG: nucleotide sugar dehydrogenase [Candidatus Bathyarchaeota archaeon]|nr:MAG: nucleotide sugar dehydrogenase [Candidatus Bathyarchaeota archaeon]
MISLEIVVIGMGYVGIPAAALFANVENFNVIGVQRRSKRSGWKIDYINAGKCPIEGDEPGLAELIKKVVEKGSFRVTDNASVCKKADVILIDVQTPVDQNHEPRYESLKEVSRAVGKHMKKGAMVVIESTVAPGTTDFIVKPILEESSGMKAGENFNLVYSYERVMVGRLLHNLKYMPRIVGGLTPKCAQRAVKFYKKINKAELLATDCLTAEVAKVTENTYRDVNIAFANEIALICESLGVNVHDVRRFVNSLPNDPSDPARNPYRMMHIPGAGAGGHCLPKDPWLLKHGLDAYGGFKFTPKIVVESRKLNDYMPHHMKNLMEEALREKSVRPEDASVCILGLAFLGDSNDPRNTPALPLYNLLKDICRKVVVHDPYIKEFEGIVPTNNLEDALRNRDCAILVTSHKEYANIQLDWLKSILATPVIVDGRNVFDPKDCKKTGFSYRGVGIGVRK